jgi:DNA-binding CsgD family transcriptional regulator
VPIDERRQLGLLKRQIDEGAISSRQAEMLAMTVDGVPGEDIARHFSLARQTVRNELAMARGAVRASWAAYVAAAAFVAAAAGIWVWRMRVEPPVAHEISPDGPVDPRAAALRAKARELRSEGLRACNSGLARECLDKLDEAAGIDPRGDQDPAVQEAREAARQALSAPRLPKNAMPEERMLK